MAIQTLQPLTLTWLELVQLTAPLHLFIKAEMDALHDVWKMGAPIPQSRILSPVGYDERKVQRGNYEARIIFPNSLAKWIVDVSARRGIPCDWMQAIAITQGQTL
jgi:hypothetical protein